MKVLLTGGRAPYTLELLRIFARQGHEVHILEFIQGSLCEYSKYMAKLHLITAPNINEDSFQQELLKLQENENFDLIIPTCEEAIHLAKLKIRLPALFSVDFDFIYELHNKDCFQQLLEKQGMNSIKNYTNLTHLKPDKIYVVKEKLSRFGKHVQKIKGKDISSDLDLSTHLVQDYIQGQEYCVYLILKDGVVTAKSIYLKQFSIDGGATNLFESTNHPLINNWIDKFFQNSKESAQFSFDLFIQDNQVYPIECNPRTTSGVHLLSETLSVNHFMNSQTEQAIPLPGTIKMLALPVLMYHVRPGFILSSLKKFFKAKDVLYAADDKGILYGQFLGLWTFIKVALKKRISLLAATTDDIGYNKSK